MPVFPVFRVLFAAVCSLTMAVAIAGAQGLGALEEEERFYTNFATTNYSQEILQERLQDYYDLFGSYITNGYYLYSIDNGKYVISDEFGGDSTLAATSNEHRDEVFYQNFSNLCVSSDAIGGIKTTFLVGDQIRTRFAPLTFNKRNFEGFRWDVAYEGLGITSLFSRTRPGLMARSYEQSMGYDDLNTQIRDSWVTFPNTGVITHTDGSDWLETDYVDWTAKTMYGDYDFLWAFYLHKRFWDNIDVGVSYVNHHHSDIAKGEKWLGDVPNGLAPNEIHFEFYDQTFKNLADAGVKLHSITMTIVTDRQTYSPQPPDAFYEYGTMKNFDGSLSKGVLYEDKTVVFPYPQVGTRNGSAPIVCTFYPKEVVGRDSSHIRDIYFDIDISGNYIGYASTDRIAIASNLNWSDASARVTHKGMRDIAADTAGYGVDTVNAVYGAAPDMNETGSKGGEVFLGDYIIRSNGITSDENGNRTTMRYHYRIPTSRVTYGVDVAGKLFNVDFNGEFAANVERSKYPTSAGDVVSALNIATYLNGTYPLNERVSLHGSIFNMDPEYQPYLSTYKFSRFFHIARRSSGTDKVLQTGDFPYVLGDDFSIIDDNEDDDYYTESDRRFFPSDKNKNQGGGFYYDGQYASPKRVRLPSTDSTFSIVYDDQDGVIPDRYDRNRNGVFDYEEDFLLFDADPPRFDLEADFNGNTVPDGQEDDIYPDYPVKPVYVYTSNGFKSLGVRGIDVRADITRSANLKFDIGGSYRTAISPVRLDKSVETFSVAGEADTDEQKALQGYGRALYRLALRNKGITFFAGQELKYVRDGIRDDVVQSEMDNSAVNYYIKTDELRYRNALISRSALALTYLNIPGFQVSAKFSAEIEKHLPLTQRASVTKTYWNERLNRYDYEFTEDEYKELTSSNISSILKFGYQLEMPDNLPDWLSVLAPLSIQPQYKIMYNVAFSDAGDPRENDAYRVPVFYYDNDDSVRTALFADDWQAASRDWYVFESYRENWLLSVPILRARYPLGDKTDLVFGWQWKRSYNVLVPEENLLKQNRVIQLMINDDYLNFNLAIALGWQWENARYDINRYSELYRTGKAWNNTRSEVFCRIYAGI